MPAERIRSSIPSEHPLKATIETAIVAALNAVHEEWIAEIHAPPTAAWWVLRILRARDHRVVKLEIDPGDQNAQGITRRVVQALLAAERE